MTVQQSNILKGIGILMMLYVHLFHSVDKIPSECMLLHYGSVPLVQKLSRLAAPVPVFLMITGYGLMCKYLKGALSVKSGLRKIPVLYVPYIIILLAMMCACSFLTGENYFSDMGKILCNITGWRPTFNMNAWFLLPYVLLLLTSPWICAFICRSNIWKVFGLGLLFHIAESLYNDHAPAEIVAIHPITFCFWYIKLLFAFSLGCLLRLRTAPERLGRLNGQKAALTALFLLCFVKLHLPGIWDVFYIFAFIFLFKRLRLSVFVEKPLLFLGKHSMSMWFIHGWMMGKAFDVYCFKYPIIIYLSLIVFSLLLAIAVDCVADKSMKLLKIRG